MSEDTDALALDQDEPDNASLPFRILPPFGETNFDRISYLLQGLSTRIIYIGVPDPDIGYNRRVWNLWGNYSGSEGLELGPHVDGLMHAPFEILSSQGPYELGGVPQRTVWHPKNIKLAVQVNGDLTDSQTTSFRYRMLEQRWWNSWSDEQDGWLGVWTRTHGWRFVKVRLANESKTAFEIDPAESGGNFMQWDMDIVGFYPYYAKKAFTADFTNTNVESSTAWDLIEGVIEDLLKNFGLDGLFDQLVGQQKIGDGSVNVGNKGTVKAYPQFIVSSPGIAWIQDGDNADGTPRMVQLPTLSESDGMMLVDTDPDARTLTCATDPVDPLFYRLLRNAEFLEVLLHDVLDSTLPVWKRFDGEFTEASAIQPRETKNIKVWHSEHNGTVTAIVPQRYKMAWG